MLGRNRQNYLRSGSLGAYDLPPELGDGHPCFFRLLGGYYYSRLPFLGARREPAQARSQQEGEVSVGEAQKAAVRAHAAARVMTSKSATAAARVGHAVATAHMADHCLVAALDGLKAVEATAASPDIERAWQVEQLPDKVRELIVSALESRLKKALHRTGRHVQM